MGMVSAATVSSVPFLSFAPRFWSEDGFPKENYGLDVCFNGILVLLSNHVYIKDNSLAQIGYTSTNCRRSWLAIPTFIHEI